MNQKYCKKLILWPAAFLFFIYLYMPRISDKEVTNVVVLESSDTINSFKICVHKAAETYYNISTIFFIELIVCIRKHISIDKSLMDNFPNYMIEENKMFLPLKDHNEECKWLTVGIGGSENSEKLFKLKYPYCSVYGVEPGFTGNFSTVGKVIPFGMGTEDANIDLTVMINGTYSKKVMKVLSLTNILDDFVKSRFIHYLTIDIEGFEYMILQELVGNGKFTQTKTGIVFCQIDAELHHPQMDTAHSSIKNLNPVEFILNFLQDSSPYIPIFNAQYTHHPHQKVTFINIVDPECEAAFGFSTYFKK